MSQNKPRTMNFLLCPLFFFVQPTYKLICSHSKIRLNVVEFEAVGHHSPREGASLVSERAELLTPDSDLSECRVSIWARLEWLPGAARLPAYWDLMNLFRAYTEWKDSQGCFLSCYRRTKQNGKNILKQRNKSIEKTHFLFLQIILKKLFKTWIKPATQGKE